LPFATVHGKHYVTPADLRRMFKPCPASPKAPASISDAEGPTSARARLSPTGSSSATERLRSAQAAALNVWDRPSKPSPNTSARSGPDQTGKVIRLTSSSPTA
jgi:hypothetical protein